MKNLILFPLLACLLITAGCQSQPPVEGTWTRVYPHWEPAYEVEIWEAVGGHGGGDAPLQEDIFSASPSEDKYRRAADQRAGAWSILTGIAGNDSMLEGRPIRIDELVPDLALPDVAPMPDDTEPLEMKTES